MILRRKFPQQIRGYDTTPLEWLCINELEDCVVSNPFWYNVGRLLWKIMCAFSTSVMFSASVPSISSAGQVIEGNYVAATPWSQDFVIPEGADLFWADFTAGMEGSPRIRQPVFRDMEAAKAYFSNGPYDVRDCTQEQESTGIISIYTWRCESYYDYPPLHFTSGNFVVGYCLPPTRFRRGYCLLPDDITVIESKNNGEPCNCVGNPINPGFGNKFQEERDYADNNGLSFIRYYDSNESHDFPATIMGARWRHHLDRRIVYGGIQTPNGIVYVVRKDGKSYSFILNNGVWTPDADVSDRLLENKDASGQLTGWEYSYDTNMVDMFDSHGRLLSTGRRNGYRQYLTYSDTSTSPEIAPTPGLMLTVTDSFNRTLNFTYDASGRIKTMTDPSGGIYQYAYDGQKNLISVSTPDSNLRQYIYENTSYRTNLLIGIVDENGKRFATWSYDSAGRATSSEHAGGVERVTSNYVDANSLTTVTDALNTARTHRFTVVQGVVKTTSINQPGGTRTITYDINGNVASSTDFNGNKTCYAYDFSRNLETIRVEGLPNAADCVTTLAAAALASPVRKISTEWSSDYRLPTKIAEPKSLTINTYDASGNLLSRTVQATNDETGIQGFVAAVTGNVRKWIYTYNQYGKVLSVTGPRTDVVSGTTYTYDSQGNLTSVANAAGHITTLSNYDAKGNVGRITDANGLITDLAYSPRGWITSRTVGGETITYDYDGVGQMTKVTQPDGSYLSYTYDDAHRLTEIADNLGNRIVYTLDAMGNRINEQVQDPSGTLARQTSRVYDALNRLQQITGAQ